MAQCLGRNHHDVIRGVVYDHETNGVRIDGNDHDRGIVFISHDGESEEAQRRRRPIVGGFDRVASRGGGVFGAGSTRWPALTA
mmetsp:Transcript_4639/g.9659  ORF Transcript_4639/g.9659 Transcript_4639/m.9659 type:complete len:83 (-) Transcript_4639:69-317(-)